ncbi:rRNA-processing protein sof1 [Lobosporangium transversale]|uniref:WD40-repeat-containing domain protein n=1 Tax=Lobosporangium transversale TaxID=64571 RepID=A0A1Y2GWQ3_9FUNG|nr:WD40-repeat-containing domain protein [Lobosporangium transversale]KAF9913523.1 rRNA-processing protein sof1 [Lobosporangium transversale]ORZ23854.1 WD40-repeat-containing domain protein [Lobosporangium transversale]|eukprot:XP_021883668.1 WD40-repeat-containing domain protein [Lobosporangium transversale]
MKVKVLSRSTEEFTRQRSNDIHKIQRNLDPTLHPFEKAREYTRALNATKVERMFAKPFIGALSGHVDGVYCMAKHPKQLDWLVSGGGDGDLRMWSLSEQKTLWSTIGHKAMITGVSSFLEGSRFLSCSNDRTVKIWDPTIDRGDSTVIAPVETYPGKNAFTGISHHRSDNIFATSGSEISIWDHNRTEPVQNLNWGVDTINTVKFNQTETSVIASTGSDRTIILYDLRTSQPVTKLILAMRTNAIAWNPMEAFNFMAANEDHNIYAFDMRKMDKAQNILKDHVSAVMSVDYSPTGEEIVTGGYDRTVRLFNARQGHSRDIYHTNRMQRVFTVLYTMDNKYVLSGSDDGNVRLWKARASEKMGPRDYRERAHLEYSEKLKEKFAHVPEIRRINRHRNVPKAIKTATKKKSIMINARKVKEENVRKHTKTENLKERIPERKKPIVAVKK